MRSRAIFANEHNIASMAKTWGTSAAVVTITFPEQVSNREREKRIASLVNNELNRHYGAAIVVRHIHESGQIHYHGLVRATDKHLSSPRVLREEQGRWRRIERTYHLGRTEIQPIRDAEKYAAYLVKDFHKEVATDKRIRRVSYIGDARNIKDSPVKPRLLAADFCFAFGRGQQWRKTARQFSVSLLDKGLIREATQNAVFEFFKDRYEDGWFKKWEQAITYFAWSGRLIYSLQSSLSAEEHYLALRADFAAARRKRY
jgi:hypothetical protein